MNYQNLDPKEVFNNFELFLRLVWDARGFVPPTEPQIQIARYLTDPTIKRGALQCHRGSGKSDVTAAFALYKLCQNPDEKILVLSATSDKAKSFTKLCMDMIYGIDFLDFLKPVGDQRASSIAFDVGPAAASATPSVYSRGIKSQITGLRSSLIIGDDIEIMDNSATQPLRDKLLEKTQEFESIILPGGDSKILYLGTPQSTFTVYRDLALRGYKPLVWPARYPDDIDAYDGCLAPMLVDALAANPELAGTPTDSRFPERELKERLASTSPAYFQLQFLLNTDLSDSDKFPLKVKHLMVRTLGKKPFDHYEYSDDKRYALNDYTAYGLKDDYYVAPSYVSETLSEYTSTVISVDPAAGGKDETVAVVVSVTREGFYCLRAMRAFSETGYTDGVMQEIIKLARTYDCHQAIVEKNMGHGMYGYSLSKIAVEMGYAIGIDEVTATTRKEKRIIDTLAPVFHQHRLIVDPQVIQYDNSSNPKMEYSKRLERMLFRQIPLIFDQKDALSHDDRVDALSQAIAWFAEDAAKVAKHERAFAKRSEEEALAELRDIDSSRSLTAQVLGWDIRKILDEGDYSKVWDWS